MSARRIEEALISEGAKAVQEQQVHDAKAAQFAKDDLQQRGVNYWKQVLLCDPEDSKCNNFILEECFPLANDPALHQAGVQACARVEHSEITQPGN